MSVGKKLRFEVFKRDKFTCQYCGKAAPDVLLHADHIEPKSKGGKNTILNLITACEACNLGKGAHPLDDDSVVSKQRRQLEALEERQQQLRMMLDWQQSLSSLDDEAMEGLQTMWVEMTGYRLNHSGEKDLRKHIRSFGVAEVAEAMRIARDTYLVYTEDGTATDDSFEKAFTKLGGICNNRKQQRENPYHYDTQYILATLRNRFSYWKFYSARQLVTTAFQMGMSKACLYDVAVRVTSPSRWEEEMQNLISGEEL